MKLNTIKLSLMNAKKYFFSLDFIEFHLILKIIKIYLFVDFKVHPNLI